MYALLHFGSQHPDQLSPFRKDLLAFYCDTVIGAKTPVPAENLDAYSPLLRQLTQQEFSNTVLPAILKFVRRTTEAALVSIKALVTVTQLDLSDSAHDLLDQLLKLVRGSKESVRYSGHTYLQFGAQLQLHMRFIWSLSVSEPRLNAACRFVSYRCWLYKVYPHLISTLTAAL